MSTKSFLTVIGVLTVSLLATNPTFAQAPDGLFSGAGQRGEFWEDDEGEGSMGYYYAPGASRSSGNYQSYYSGPGQASPGQALPRSRAVRLELHVPADAKVWVEDAATTQTGSQRRFYSPALTPGKKYVYHLRVQWKDGDQMKDQTRTVLVKPGDRVTLAFGPAEDVASQ